MDYRITGLPVAHFASVLQLDDDALRAHGVERVVVDAPDAFPCRITLEDAAPGEEVLLLSYAHQPAPTPYASAGPRRVAGSLVRSCLHLSSSRSTFSPMTRKKKLLG